MDLRFCRSCSADGGGGGIGGNAGSPRVLNFRKSNGCMLCSLFNGDTVKCESNERGGEFDLLVTTALPAVDDEE